MPAHAQPKNANADIRLSRKMKLKSSNKRAKSKFAMSKLQIAFSVRDVDAQLVLSWEIRFNPYPTQVWDPILGSFFCLKYSSDTFDRRPWVQMKAKNEAHPLAP